MFLYFDQAGQAIRLYLGDAFHTTRHLDWYMTGFQRGPRRAAKDCGFFYRTISPSTLWEFYRMG